MSLVPLEELSIKGLKVMKVELQKQMQQIEQEIIAREQIAIRLEKAQGVLEWFDDMKFTINSINNQRVAIELKPAQILHGYYGVEFPVANNIKQFATENIVGLFSGDTFSLYMQKSMDSFEILSKFQTNRHLPVQYEYGSQKHTTHQCTIHERGGLYTLELICTTQDFY